MYLFCNFHLLSSILAWFVYLIHQFLLFEPSQQLQFYRDRLPAVHPTPDLEDRVPILVAFYDMHGLQWDYSFPWSPHGDFVKLRHQKVHTSSPQALCFDHFHSNQNLYQNSHLLFLYRHFRSGLLNSLFTISLFLFWIHHIGISFPHHNNF
jgi:hypothetical protein